MFYNNGVLSVLRKFQTNSLSLTVSLTRNLGLGFGLPEGPKLYNSGRDTICVYRETEYEFYLYWYLYILNKTFLLDMLFLIGILILMLNF